MSALGHTNTIGSLWGRSRSQTLSLTASTSRSSGCQSGRANDGVPNDSGLRQSQRRLRKTASSECKASSISVSLDTLEVASSADAEQDNGSFEHMVEQSSTPILVDFYAPWCGPCQLMSKIVADISTEMKDDLKVMKINTDSYPNLASKYRIQALPTCLLFRDGKVIDRVDGFMPEPSFGKRIRFYVARLDKKFGRR